MSEVRLSTKQKSIVESRNDSMLIIASAGSGKTRVLTERIRYLLTSSSGTFKVLALTFTNKAAEEMEQRLKNVPGINNRAFIGTLHKFCLEIIRSKGSLIGQTEMPHIYEKENDRKEILLEVFENSPQLKEYLERYDDKEKQKFLFDVLSFISQKKKNLFGLVANEENVDAEILQLFNEYNLLLISQNAIDFDDVICLAYKILAERPKVAELYRGMYKHISIDEAQDLNFAQYEFIKILAGETNKNVLMVGDPNQAIYGFNGSDKKFMLDRFVADFKAETVELTENYRSSKAVIKVANKLINSSIDIANAAIEGEFEIKECENEIDEARWVVDKIKDFLVKQSHPDVEGKIVLERIAILARNKYIFKCVEEELNKSEMAYFYKTTGDLSTSESDLMKIFDLGIRILVNPLDKLHFIQLCKMVEIDDFPIVDYQNGLDKLKKTKELILNVDFQNDFITLLEAWEMIFNNINSFAKGLDCIEKSIFDTTKPLKGENEKFLIIEDIKSLRSTWKNYSLQAETENKTLANFRNQMALGITFPIKNANGITLGTVHSVKGLEYDIVFIIGMNEGTFPDFRAVKEGGPSLNEEKNNLFVAITRSRRLLYISYPKKKFMPWDKINGVVQRQSRYISVIS